MPSAKTTWQAAICVAILGMVSVLLMSGYNSKPSDGYRVISQKDVNSSFGDSNGAATISLDGALHPADAQAAENSTPVAVHARVAVEEVDLPASALHISNRRKTELLIPYKSFIRDKKTQALRISYDDLDLLAVLNMEPVTDDAVSLMPGWMTSLSGKMVRVRGFMYPAFQAEGLERFVLVRDNQRCCFGPGAKIYDHIQVNMKEGTTTNYVPEIQAFDVVGRFRIDLRSGGGKLFGLYVIDEASVIIR